MVDSQQNSMPPVHYLAWEDGGISIVALSCQAPPSALGAIFKTQIHTFLENSYGRVEGAKDRTTLDRKETLKQQ